MINATIKTAYPSQYYGVSSGSVLAYLIDTWNGVTISGLPVNMAALGAASTLVALSAAEWELAGITPASGALKIYVSDTAIQYPARFYCDKNTPCGVYDMWGYSSLTSMPAVTDLYAITAAEYADRLKNPRPQYYNTTTSALADYVAPVVVIPLKTQAVTAQAWIQQQANLAAAMGETFTTDMRAYVTAINAIASGTDTTSTALPVQPTDVMTAA